MKAEQSKDDLLRITRPHPTILPQPGNAPAQALTLEERRNQITLQCFKHISPRAQLLAKPLRKPGPTSWPGCWPQKQAAWPVRETHKSQSLHEAALWSLPPYSEAWLQALGCPQPVSKLVEISTSIGGKPFLRNCIPSRASEISPLFPACLLGPQLFS